MSAGRGSGSSSDGEAAGSPFKTTVTPATCLAMASVRSRTVGKFAYLNATFCLLPFFELVTEKMMSPGEVRAASPAGMEISTLSGPVYCTVKLAGATWNW